MLGNEGDSTLPRCLFLCGIVMLGNEGDSTLPRRLFLCGIVMLGNEGDSTLPLRLFFRGIVMLVMSYICKFLLARKEIFSFFFLRIL